MKQKDESSHFTGRKEEKLLVESFLDKQESGTFVVAGESGVGKTAFLEELTGLLREKYYVGHVTAFYSHTHPHEPFTMAVSNLFQDIEQKLGGETKKKLFSTFLKNFVLQVKSELGTLGEALLLDIKEKLEQKIGMKNLTKKIQDILLETRKKSRKENFIPTNQLKFLLGQQERSIIFCFINLLNLLDLKKRTVLILDQFERAESSANFLLDVSNNLPKNFFLIVSFKTEGKGLQVFKGLKPELADSTFIDLEPFSIFEIRDFIRKARNQVLAIEICAEIKARSGGLPEILSEWVNQPGELNLLSLEKGDKKRKLQPFYEARIKLLSEKEKEFVRFMSAFLFPPPTESYELLTGFESNHLQDILLSLNEHNIFKENWFRHELIHDFVYSSLTKNLREENHSRIAKSYLEIWGGFDNPLDVLFFGKFVCRHIDLSQKSFLELINDFPIEERAEMLNHFGLFNEHQGNLREARSFYEKSIELRGDCHDRKIQGVYHNLAGLCQLEGENDRAMFLLRKSLNAAIVFRDFDLISKSYNGIGICLRRKGKLKRALRFFQKAAYLKQEMGNINDLAKSYGNIGNTLLQLGDAEESVKWHEKSLEIKKALFDAKGIGHSHFNLGNVYLELRRAKEALENFEMALKFFSSEGSKLGIASALSGIGNALFASEKYEEAIEPLSASYNLFLECGSKEYTKVNFLLSVIQTKIGFEKFSTIIKELEDRMKSA